MAMTFWRSLLLKSEKIGALKRSSRRELGKVLRLGRIKRKIFPTPGHRFSSFWTRTFPKNPVAPVMRMFLPLKNSITEAESLTTLTFFEVVSKDIFLFCARSDECSSQKIESKVRLELCTFSRPQRSFIRQIFRKENSTFGIISVLTWVL